MSSKKQRKPHPAPASAKPAAKNQQATPSATTLSENSFLSGKYFVVTVTALFFLTALLGILKHEMWRDEHQAWLLARDSTSLLQLIQNMRYDGHPVLWHTLLHFITLFTHNPAYMQALHLVIATAFIFVFLQYAPIEPLYKILFTFGYFALYEYSIISRNYAVGLLLIFTFCALFRNRKAYYILIGLVLGMLANANVYALIISLGLTGILLLDYIIYQDKNSKLTIQLSVGAMVYLSLLAFSLYQIWPDENNSFPAPYATTLSDTPRWAFVASKIFTTYFYIPAVDEINFWNTNIYFGEGGEYGNNGFGAWILPILVFFAGVLTFLRKPFILLLYLGLTTALVGMYYYTFMVHSRYVGHLLITLVICLWMSAYYKDKIYDNSLLRNLSSFGKKLSKPFLIAVLGVNVIGAVVAYSFDLGNKFTTAKDAATYIRQNKLDTLTMAGTTDFSLAAISTYTDKKIFYPQMSDFGSFCIWSKQRKNDISFQELVASLDTLIRKQQNQKLLLVKDHAPQISLDGKNYIPLEHGIIAHDVQIDMLNAFEPGIVADEKFYIYLLQKVDTSKIDYTKYIVVN